MERLVIAIVLIVVALVVAGFVTRRRPDPPTQPRSAPIPQQLDRSDFLGQSSTWLVVLFSSDTCDACEAALAKANSLADDDTYVQEVTWQSEPELHQRYSIDTVPLMAIAGPDGAVGAGFVGLAPTTELWAAMATLRE